MGNHRGGKEGRKAVNWGKVIGYGMIASIAVGVSAPTIWLFAEILYGLFFGGGVP